MLNTRTRKPTKKLTEVNKVHLLTSRLEQVKTSGLGEELLVECNKTTYICILASFGNQVFGPFGSVPMLQRHTFLNSTKHVVTQHTKWIFSAIKLSQLVDLG